MRLIKVVHQGTAEDLQAERVLPALQTYDVEGFVSRTAPDLKKLEDEAVSEAIELKGRPQKADTVKTFSRYYLAGFHYRGELRERWRQKACEHTVRRLLGDLQKCTERLEVITLETARQRFPRTTNLSIGTYTLHPLDDRRLTRLEHYHASLALEKDDELIDLLGKMGARTVTIVDAGTHEKSGSGHVDAGVIRVDAKGSATIASKLATGKQYMVIFEGNVVDIDPHLLETSLWFADDGQLNSIFRSRCFAPNPLLEYTYRNTYTRTFDFDFDLAARSLVAKADLKAEYDTLSQTERFFHVQFAQ